MAVQAVVGLFVVEGIVWLLLVAFTVSILAVGWAAAASPWCGAYLVFGVLDLAIAYGLWALARSARIAAIVLAAVGLVAFPLGTVFGVLDLILLFQPTVRRTFGDVPSEPYRTPYGAYTVQGRGQAPASPVDAPPVPESAARLCGRCGSRLGPDDATCPSCGAPVS